MTELEGEKDRKIEHEMRFGRENGRLEYDEHIDK